MKEETRVVACSSSLTPSAGFVYYLILIRLIPTWSRKVSSSGALAGNYLGFGVPPRWLIDSVSGIWSVRFILVGCHLFR